MSGHGNNRRGRLVWLDVRRNLKLKSKDSDGIWSLTNKNLRDALRQLIPSRDYDVQLAQENRLGSSDRKVEFVVLGPTEQHTTLDISRNWPGRVLLWSEFLDRNKIRNLDVMDKIKENSDNSRTRSRHHRRRSHHHRHHSKTRSRSSSSTNSSENASNESKMSTSRSMNDSSMKSGSQTVADSGSRQSNNQSQSQTNGSNSKSRHRHRHHRHGRRHRSQSRNGKHRDRDSPHPSRHSYHHDPFRFGGGGVPAGGMIKVTNRTKFKIRVILYDLDDSHPNTTHTSNVIDALTLMPDRGRRHEHEGVLRRDVYHRNLSKLQCVVVTFRSSSSKRSSNNNVPPPLVMNSFATDMELAITEQRIHPVFINSVQQQQQQQGQGQQQIQASGGIGGVVGSTSGRTW